jgi:Transcriptional regulators
MPPQYIQIAEQLRHQIISGEYPIGSKIPTENKLAQSLKVSRPTVRHALDLLTAEERLVRVKGSGTFVAQPKLIHESTSFVTGYREESRKKNRILHTKVICLQAEKAGERIGAALNLNANEIVTRLTRIRHLENMYDNAPVVYTTVYVPQKLFPEMIQLDFTDISFYDALDSRKLSVLHASRKLEIIMPPVEIAASLGITTFEPTAYITSLGYTKDKLVIEYTESYYPASRSSFQIEINR